MRQPSTVSNASWLCGELVTMAGLQDRNLTKAERDNWPERLADVNRKLSLG